MAVAGAALGALAPILTVASTVVSLIGVAVTANANARAAEFAAQQADRRREIQLRNAVRATELAQAEQLRQDQIARGLIAEQIALQSASGLALEGRSQMLTRKSARRLARDDAAAIREAGEIDALNFRMAAEDEGYNAEFSRMEGRNALLSGFIEGAGIAIGGASSLIRPGTGLLGRTKPRTGPILRGARSVYA